MPCLRMTFASSRLCVRHIGVPMACPQKHQSHAKTPRRQDERNDGIEPVVSALPEHDLSVLASLRETQPRPSVTPIPKSARIYIAGHKGLVGSAIWREFDRRGYTSLIGRTRDELDLRDLPSVRRFFDEQRPEYVILAAARVGGILANDTEPVPFLLENLQIQNNVISESHRVGVRKLLFLGSSCIYPKLAPQPIREEHLLTGPLEPTNQWYAIAKIAGIKLCQAYRRQYGSDFICAMPTNLYGPNDNYDPRNSHVLPALIRRFHEAKSTGAREVVCWGTGSPRREFLYVDDLARACLFLLERYSDDAIINVGSGADLPIRDLADMVARAVGFEGAIVWDDSKPDGTPRKLMDSARILGMGWQPEVSLEEGIRRAYADFMGKTVTVSK